MNIEINKVSTNRDKFTIAPEQLFELIRYGLVGTFSFLTYVVVSNFLHFIGVLALIATLIAALLSLSVSYFGHIYITYKVRPAHTRMSWRFLTLTAINLLLVQGLTWFLHIHLGVAFGPTSIIVSLATPFVSWPIGKFWVFAEC